ncbi:MAG: hypothetical protein FJW63_03670 [Actinobacteria bacterium]|nr:hypothetical protein [Actinomycetota bacterium]
MIGVKEAAKNAYEYMKEIPGFEERIDIVVEEVELSEDESTGKKYWLITLGYPVGFNILQPTSRSKEYKIFKVDADTGEVLSMKIRNI